MYKVFTPFKNAFIRRLRDGLPACVAAPKPRQAPARRRRRCLSLTTRKRRLTGCCLPRMKNGAGASARVLSASGGGLRGAARLPGRGRDQSPVALPAIGVLSPPVPASSADGTSRRAGRRSRRHRLNELIWREFYRHLMVYYPKLCKGRPFTARTDKVAGAQRRPPCRPGSAGRPVFRLLMPPCAS